MHHLVLCTGFTSHRNVAELQEQNQRLLTVIRDLSEQQEEREQEMMDETLDKYCMHPLLLRTPILMQSQTVKGATEGSLR